MSECGIRASRSVGGSVEGKEACVEEEYVHVHIRCMVGA